MRTEVMLSMTHVPARRTARSASGRGVNVGGPAAGHACEPPAWAKSDSPTSTGRDGLGGQEGRGQGAFWDVRLFRCPEPDTALELRVGQPPAPQPSSPVISRSCLCCLRARPESDHRPSTTLTSCRTQHDPRLTIPPPSLFATLLVACAVPLQPSHWLPRCPQLCSKGSSKVGGHVRYQNCDPACACRVRTGRIRPLCDAPVLLSHPRTGGPWGQGHHPPSSPLLPRGQKAPAGLRLANHLGRPCFRGASPCSAAQGAPESCPYKGGVSGWVVGRAHAHRP